MSVSMEYNSLEQHLLHTCNIASSDVCLETNYSISSFREGHVRALTAKAPVWDHSNYMFTWHRKSMISPNDRQKRKSHLKPLRGFGTLLTFKGEWKFKLSNKDTHGCKEVQSAVSYRIHPSMTKHGQYFVPGSRKILADDLVILLSIV
jgi:hypothetical protein